ncbi:hypothetical protein METHB2_550026 [Candidatus Methylobacter favarea]|uniref:Uncharacterized protein n=1 Tax=Candidatus Methylobacter favarea TaxID=2707345 RepID=A0A8S0YAJ1_9GAMM|nr:hypothetical protein METHB2_550026 [Candidatus Methylobacter favarea]
MTKAQHLLNDSKYRLNRAFAFTLKRTTTLGFEFPVHFDQRISRFRFRRVEPQALFQWQVMGFAAA